MKIRAQLKKWREPLLELTKSNPFSILQSAQKEIKTTGTLSPAGPQEIVLVDDGSSDRTLEVLEAAAEKPGGSVLVTTSSIALIRRRTSGSRAATQPIDASGVGASQR